MTSETRWLSRRRLGALSLSVLKQMLYSARCRYRRSRPSSRRAGAPRRVVVVRLNDGVGHLGRRKHREGGHHSVGELLADLGDEEGTHTGTGTPPSEWVIWKPWSMSQFSASLRTTSSTESTSSDPRCSDPWPSCYGTGLTKDKVVGTEETTEGTGTGRVHGTGLQVDEDGTRHVLVAAGLIVVDVDAGELVVRVADVVSVVINSVLVPESTSRTWYRPGYHTDGLKVDCWWSWVMGE